MTPDRKFEHSLVQLAQLPVKYVDGKRFYQAPTGEWYKSVTTILGEKLDKSGLNEWREKIGDTEADRISAIAARRGKAIHAMLEAYVKNDDRYAQGAMPVNIETFSRVKKVIDEHVGKIYGIECPLYSHLLKTAGSADLVADWDDEPAIIDLKGSTTDKKEEWIEGYFLQTAAYAVMFEERTGIRIDRTVVLVGSDTGLVQTLARHRSASFRRLKEVFVDGPT
jgi:hypothetical protein